jgi:predicted nucleic acid-binding protein
MARFINPLFVNSSIDTNIVHHVATETWEPIRHIIELYRADKIRLIIPYSVHTELLRSTTPTEVHAAAQDFIFTIPVGLTTEERKERDRLIELAKGNAELKNIVPDLLHVAEAAKYGGYFITLDKRLLKRESAIFDVMGIEVVTPKRFIEQVDKAQEMMANR